MAFISEGISSFVGTVGGITVIGFLLKTSVTRWLKGYDKLTDDVDTLIKLNPVGEKECRKSHEDNTKNINKQVSNLYTKIDTNHTEIIGWLKSIKNGG